MICTEEERRLWFDVETRYKTTYTHTYSQSHRLWFDVETRYKTTGRSTHKREISCGLM